MVLVLMGFMLCVSSGILGETRNTEQESAGQEIGEIEIAQELVLELATQDLYERPLVVVVPSYKNEAWCIKNLESIFSQKYNNFRVILIIDDARQDATLSRVQEYLKEHDLENKVTIIANQARRGALANHIEAVAHCKDWEIVVQLDGDDWFAHDLVLARINTAYADPQVWLTYGQHEVYPKGKKGQCRAVPKNVLKLAAYREYAWITSALRTFYAGLFKQIKLEDFIDNGAFFATSCDFAFMIPMLEMAQGRIQFIDEILYIYNCETPLNDYKKNLQQQLHNEYIIRSRPKYKPLEKLELYNGQQKYQDKEYQDGQEQARKSAALLVCSTHPERLKKVLESAQENLRNCAEIVVLVHTDSDAVLRLYRTLEQELSQNLVPVKSVYTQKDTCKQQLLRELQSCACTHILFADDRSALARTVDCSELISWLERTHAHGFYLARGVDRMSHPLLERQLKKPKLITLAPGVCAWQFKHGEYEWAAANTHDMVLYTKAFLIDSFAQLKAPNIDQLLYGWRLQYHTPDAVGLCFDKSRVGRVQG
jgi:glycosyltransferase involved in cell wall biosynthesis